MDKKEVAVFGGGCFWCTEAIFRGLKGVMSVAPGYAGGAPAGNPPNRRPTYEEVCTGKTGHAEVIKIEFDPDKISYVDLLAVFFATHDPTTLNRQGDDVGEQYRSVILYADENQKAAAESFIAELEKSSSEEGRIVTEVKPLKEFYEAEEYHQDYYRKNRSAPYCQVIINPKLRKAQEKFAKLLKNEDLA